MLFCQWLLMVGFFLSFLVNVYKDFNRKDGNGFICFMVSLAAFIASMAVLWGAGGLSLIFG
jgi:hypothetical protein